MAADGGKSSEGMSIQKIDPIANRKPKVPIRDKDIPDRKPTMNSTVDLPVNQG